MRAITLNEPDTQPTPREDLPAPTPADNEVLVRVHASSVNPVDGSIAAGLLAGMGVEYEYPVILGRDYAGTVEQTGSAVSGFKPGDQVFGFLLHANPTARDGAWTELLTVTEEQSIASVPEGVDLATAGVAPLAGITAITAIDALDLKQGDVLLVAGATGGVGSLAVQLAAKAGATVVAPALPEDEEFLRGARRLGDRRARRRRLPRRPRALPRRRRRAARPRQLRARHLRRRAEGRRAHRLAHRRRR
jgi:NADPH:quinone reductase